MIDETTIDWADVTAVTYRIEQRLRYEYAAPIRDLRHRLVIAPRRRHGDQERLANRVWATADAPIETGADAFGNEVAALHVPCVESSITFGLDATVRRDRANDAPLPVAAGAGETTRRDERRLTRPDDALLQAAAEIAALHPNPHELPDAILRFVERSMVYTKGLTDVFTTASTAFAMRRGVCQDYAHVTIALARACGLGARYVSGHLIGEGATHAWVELIASDARHGTTVVSVDPTRGKPTDLRYVVVAIGRDYEDVAPTSGVFTGKAGGTLHGTQHVELLDVRYAA